MPLHEAAGKIGGVEEASSLCRGEGEMVRTSRRLPTGGDSRVFGRMHASTSSLVHLYHAHSVAAPSCAVRYYHRFVVQQMLKKDLLLFDVCIKMQVDMGVSV